MSDALVLPAAAWRPAGGMVAAGVQAPQAGGVAILAEGWAEPGAARLLQAGSAPVAFVPFGSAAFLATFTEAGAALTIEAPAPPRRCRVAFVPRPAASPALGLFAPRAIRSPARRETYDLAAGQGRVRAALAALDLDGALGVAAEMLLAAPAAAATRMAVADLLAHLARHPLDRSPALGAFVAALTE